MEFDVSIFDELTFSDDLEPNFKVGTLTDSLNFAEAVSSNIQYLQIAETLTFGEQFSFGGVYHQVVLDTLAFTDSTSPRVWVEVINDFLFMYDEVQLFNGGVIVDTLNFTDSAVGLDSLPTQTDVLTFTDAAVPIFFPHKTITDTVAFIDSFSCLLLNTNSASTTVGYVPPTVEPTLVFTDRLGLTLTVRQPDFNDSDTITYTRINRTSRGYTPIITGIAGWFPKKARKVTFTYLTEKDTNNVRAFWTRNAGLPVTLVDIYGDVRSVILQNPEFEVAQVGRENRTLTMDLYVL